MRFSKMLISTFKEVPADAQVISHQLMFRAGFIVKSGSGLYSYSPLLCKVIEKLNHIIRDELNKKGCLEIVLPMVTPSELWEESNRLHEMGDLLTVFNDRSERKLCLSPTNEEAVVDYFRKNAKSYKQLPTTLYQINTKFRDEIRPRFGLMRAREFTMKDAYSFHINKESLDVTYEEMYNCYEAILKRCQLDFIIVEADGGSIAGSEAKTHEFQVLAENGEDDVIVCKQENYAANTEAAVTKRNKTTFNLVNQDIEKVKTPNKTTIESVCDFLNKPLEHAIKAMVYKSTKGDESRVTIALLLGDDKANEVKIKNYINADYLELMSDEEINKAGLVKGYIGPLNLPKNIQIILDESIDQNAFYVTGANEKEYHLTGVCPKRDFTFKQVDIRATKKSDVTIKGNPISFVKGIEVGHIFQLGDKYTKLMKASVLDEQGKAKFPLMGCYGIGVGRLIAATIEQNFDDKGICWPEALAPFKVVIITTSQKDEDVVSCAEEIYSKLIENNVDVIFDDRSISVGIKFKDADLIGFPLKIIVGKKWKEDKLVEVKKRKNDESIVDKKEKIIEFCSKK